jgi:hypothetical protein
MHPLELSEQPHTAEEAIASRLAKPAGKIFFARANCFGSGSIGW